MERAILLFSVGLRGPRLLPPRCCPWSCRYGGTSGGCCSRSAWPALRWRSSEASSPLENWRLTFDEPRLGASSTRSSGEGRICRFLAMFGILTSVLFALGLVFATAAVFLVAVVPLIASSVGSSQTVAQCSPNRRLTASRHPAGGLLCRTYSWNLGACGFLGCASGWPSSAMRADLRRLHATTLDRAEFRRSGVCLVRAGIATFIRCVDFAARCAGRSAVSVGTTRRSTFCWIGMVAAHLPVWFWSRARRWRFCEAFRYRDTTHDRSRLLGNGGRFCSRGGAGAHVAPGCAGCFAAWCFGSGTCRVPNDKALANEGVHTLEHFCFFITALMFLVSGNRTLPAGVVWTTGSTLLFVATLGLQNGLLGALPY